jgi:CBS domain-containing protein
MKVADWIRAHPGRTLIIAPSASLEEALDRMLEVQGARDIYVSTNDGAVVGHLSHRRLAQSFLLEHSHIHTRRQLMERVVGATVEEFMDGHPVFAHPDEELDNVLQRQLDHDVEDMLVIDDVGSVLGAVNLSEVLREFRLKVS